MLCPWICIAQASDMRNPRYLRTTRPGRHPCPKKLVFSWYQTCQTLCHLGGTCFFFQVMPIVLWQRQRSQMEVRCFKLVDGPFIYLLSMCLNVRCPETRWFLTRMIFRKSAGPLILLTSTPCSFGLAAVCHLLGPTLNQQFLDVPTPKISSKNMDVSLPLHSPKRLNMIWKNRYQPLPNPCQYSDHSLYTFSRKMLIRWILVSWYPFAKNQFPFFFFGEKRGKLASPISHHEGAEDWPFICNVCHGWVKWFDQVMQAACSVHRLLSRWEMKISGRKLVKLLPPMMDWSAPSCALSFLGKPWKVSQTLMSF